MAAICQQYRRGAANARDSSGSLCLESSAHFFSGVSFDLLMSQEEPTQLAMMCYRDEGLEAVHRARTPDYQTLFWADCHQILALDSNQLKRWWCDKPNVTEPLSADGVIGRAPNGVDSVIQRGEPAKNCQCIEKGQFQHNQK